MDKIIYLDNAATTFPKPDIVHDSVREFYASHGVNPGRTGCDLAVEAEAMIQKTRKKFSRLFNESTYTSGNEKDSNRLGFALNATAAMNLVINGTIEAGDHIVTTCLEHNSVIRPVNHKVRDGGAEATYVAPDAEGYLDPEEIRKAIKKNTKLVIVNHASNVTGVVQDIVAIGAVCREARVPFALDSAQTAGVLPIDMMEANLSFVVFTGHKGLFGPTGTGGLCVADDTKLKGSIFGGTGVRSAILYHLEEYPYLIEAGTQNVAGIAGLSAGLDWVLERGMDNIYAHEMELMGRLQEGLQAIDNVTLWGTTNLERRIATLSMTLKNYDASDVGTLLDVEYGVQTRTGLQCAPLIHEHHGTTPRGTVRFSIGPFNTEEHIDTAIRAVEEIASDRP